MDCEVGFSQKEITPPIGTLKVGWKKKIVSDTVLDPLFAKVAVIQGDGQVAFVQLDTLSVRWTQVNEIRNRISELYGFSGEKVMVAATHNHAGPAVVNAGDVTRDDDYIESMVQNVVSAFGEALEKVERAEIGTGHTYEFNVGFNRRVVMRDGTVITHGSFDDPKALCLEGPIDPEVHVMAARNGEGKLLGCIVNFACHPAHHGGSRELSGGFPEVLADIMAGRGCPVTVFLNGASGNVTTVDPTRGGHNLSKEEAGRKLADDVDEVISGISFTPEVECSSVTKQVTLPFRELTEDQIQGKAPGAQRFIDSAIYEREMPRLIRKIESIGGQPAEIQVNSVDDAAYAGVPSEYFSQLALRIKEQSHPLHALVVGHANGMVGYVPHRAAFERGGYETTLCGSSRLAPEAGDILADGAIELIRGLN